MLLSDSRKIVPQLLLLFICFFFYIRLLDLYLNPEDGKEPMFKAAVRLLHNRGVSLDPLQVLEVPLALLFYV